MAIKGTQTEKTRKILDLIKKGLSNSEICSIVGCNQVCISTIKTRNNIPKQSTRKHNWKEIQKFYDAGNSLSECYIKFNICRATFRKAQKRGEFHARPQQEGVKLRYDKYGGHLMSVKAKKQIQQTILSKVESGNWHYSFSKVRTHEFNSKFAGQVKLMGRWELEYAQYLDDNNIEWRRPKEKFYYEYSGLKSGSGYYTPDFFLIKEEIYIEIKGYETDKDRAKWKWFPVDHKHKVLKYQDLKEIGLTLSKK
jgi:transcriptional regulator